MTGPDGLAGMPPEGDPHRLVQVLAALALAAEFVALVESNPAAAMSAGLLAWTMKVLLDLR